MPFHCEFLIVNHPLVQIRLIAADLLATKKDAISSEMAWYPGVQYMNESACGPYMLSELRAEVSVGNVTEIYVGEKNQNRPFRYAILPYHLVYLNRDRQRPITSPWQTSSALNSDPSSVR